VWSFNFSALGVENLDVTVAEVITEEEDERDIEEELVLEADF